MKRYMTYRLNALRFISMITVADRLIPENRNSHRPPPFFLRAAWEAEMAYNLEELNHFFSYDVKSGLIYHRNCVKKKWREGTPAGYLKKDGYWMVNIMGRSIAYARAAWMLYYQNDIPSGFQVDHINHDRGDHYIKNLRLVLPRENCLSRRARLPNGELRFPNLRNSKIDALAQA